jgi:hypothetical protein
LDNVLEAALTINGKNLVEEIIGFTTLVSKTAWGRVAVGGEPDGPGLHF